ESVDESVACLKKFRCCCRNLSTRVRRYFADESARVGATLSAIPTRSCWRRFVRPNNCHGSDGVCHRPLPARHLPPGTRSRRSILPKSHNGRKVSPADASSCEPTRIRRELKKLLPFGFHLPFHLDNVYSVKVTNERAGDVAGATSREFASGQRVFGRYTLVKVLGRGGMGIVWLARDEELERDVALKFVPDLMIQDHSVFDQLKRETKRCLELTHPHIVRIHDFVHDERSGCISMEYIDGETLSNLRAEKEQKVFEPDEIADWTGQLCDALD